MLLCCNQHSDTARCMHTICICTYHSDNMCTLHLPTTGNNTVSTTVYACTSTQIYCVLDIRFSCFLQRCKADSECTEQSLRGDFQVTKVHQFGTQPWQQKSHLLLPYMVSYYPHILCIQRWRTHISSDRTKRKLTCISAGHEGELAIFFVRVQALQ